MIIYSPKTRKEERKYIIDYIFKERLGLDFHLEFHEMSQTVIEYNDDKIVFEDILLSMPEENWLSRVYLDSLINYNLFNLSSSFSHATIDGTIPVILSSGKPYLKSTEHFYNTNIDIIGTIFAALTRYEEYCEYAPDYFGRFSLDGSILGSNNLISRPIVDEYISLLTSILNISLDLDSRALISCDVDWPYLYKSQVINVKSIIKKNLLRLIKGQYRQILVDPNDNFDYMIKIADRYNQKIHFNFIPLQPESLYRDRYHDPSYSITDNSIGNLMKNINNRGHIIGIHPSFYSCDEEKYFQDEINLFFRTVSNLEIKQRSYGMRKHYLRWNMNKDLAYINSRKEISFDNTLGFAAKPGFRCGTSHPFKPFNLITREVVSFIEIPLLIMDTSFYEDKYNPSNVHAICEIFNDINAKVKYYGGVMSILFHNDRLALPNERKVFEYVMSSLAQHNNYE